MRPELLPSVEKILNIWLLKIASLFSLSVKGDAKQEVVHQSTKSGLKRGFEFFF